MAFTTALSLPSAARLHHRLPNRSSLNLPRTIRCSSPSISVSPSKSMQFDLRSYWTTLISEINTKLEEAIPVKYPQQIYEAMRYSVLAKGGKRAPPVMCVAVCELFGGDRLAAFPTACALEMVRPKQTLISLAHVSCHAFLVLILTLVFHVFACESAFYFSFSVIILWKQKVHVGWLVNLRKMLQPVVSESWN